MRWWTEKEKRRSTGEQLIHLPDIPTPVGIWQSYRTHEVARRSAWGTGKCWRGWHTFLTDHQVAGSPPPPHLSTLIISSLEIYSALTVSLVATCLSSKIKKAAQRGKRCWKNKPWRDVSTDKTVHRALPAQTRYFPAEGPPNYRRTWDHSPLLG